MTALLQTLYEFAMQHHMDALLTQYQQEITENEAMCAEALSRIALPAEAADWFSRYQYGQAVLNAVHSEAAFRSGLSLGLELAFLGQRAE